MPLQRRGCRRGFTLLELLAVGAIVAILTAIAIGAWRGSRERAAIVTARAELAVLAQALEEFRRHYADYPQTGDFTQAEPEAFSRIETIQAQAKLFNALTGVFGPIRFGAGDRLNGRAFIELGRLRVEAAPSEQFLAPSGAPPRKREEATCFVDPWGRRYLYYYKRASDPNLWRAPAFVLYSAGPDGQHAPPGISGVPTAGELAHAANADNIHVHSPH